MSLILSLSLCPIAYAGQDLSAGSSSDLEATELEASDVSVDDMKKSINTVIESVEKLKDVMTPEEQELIEQIFSSATSIGTSVVGIINGGTSFLKLIGVMKDATKKSLANITRQLTNISEKLADMDKKLDEMSEQMTSMQAGEEFAVRALKATEMLDSWHDFELDYMENKMDELMNDYDSMMLNHIKSWIEFKSEDARQSDPNNTRTDMLVIYIHGRLRSLATDDDGSSNDSGDDNTDPSSLDHPLIIQELTPTVLNNIEPEISSSQVADPDPLTMYAEEFNQDFDKFLILDDTFLPESGAIKWNVNTYRDKLKEHFVEKLTALKNGSVDKTHYKEYNTDFRDWSSDDIDEYADGAVDSLMYRINYLMVNESADFSKDVYKQFGEYCKHLTSNSQGVDAMLKTIYLTHAFEFETKDDINAFCNQMLLKTGVYAMFATNVLGMSEFITDKEKTDTANSMCDAIDSVKRAYDNALTGEDAYCYVTNSVLNYADVTFSSSVEVEYYIRGAVYGYDSYTANGMKTTYSSDKALGSDFSTVGDTNALVIGYLLQNNGKAMSHDFLNEHFTTTKRTKKSALITSLKGEQVMTVDTNLLLKTHKIIGGYFYDDPEINLNKLPGSAEEEYLKYRRRIVGSTLDTGSLSLKQNAPLFGTAVYGESHWYWEIDESAVMGGPAKDPTYKDSFTTKRIDTGVFTDTYKAYYSNSVSYNCLLQIPSEHLSLKPGPNPLSDFNNLSYEMQELVQAKKDANSKLKKAIETAEKTSTKYWTAENAKAFQQLIEVAKQIVDQSRATTKELTRTANELLEAKKYYESVAKKPQNMEVTAAKKTVKAKTLKKAKKVVKAIKVTGAQGTVTYKLVSVSKKKFAKKFKINKTTGKIILKKGLKKGTYKLKVKVKASGNDSFIAAQKNVAVRIKVK